MAKTQHGRDLSGAEMAQMLDEFVNSSSSRDEKLQEFAEQIVHRTHRTLQQRIFRLFLITIEKWATTHHFDGRNAKTVELSKKINASLGDKYERYLPYI